jgi:hypothetical protein
MDWCEVITRRSRAQIPSPRGGYVNFMSGNDHDRMRATAAETTTAWDQADVPSGNRLPSEPEHQAIGHINAGRLMRISIKAGYRDSRSRPERPSSRGSRANEWSYARSPRQRLGGLPPPSGASARTVGRWPRRRRRPRLSAEGRMARRRSGRADRLALLRPPGRVDDDHGAPPTPIQSGRHTARWIRRRATWPQIE